jgi:hypothetical protein
MNGTNELKLFAPRRIFQPSLMFVWLEHTQVKRFTLALIKFLSYPQNIRLGWKGLPVTNTQAYWDSLKFTK